MTVVLKDKRSLYLHIPKTGGTWVETMLPLLGIEIERPPRLPTTTARHALPHHVLGDYAFKFTFVRHPLTWYESWWKFQSGKWRRWEPDRWHPQRVLEECASDDFSQFISNCLEREPAYVTRMFEWYVGPPGDEQFDFIGRTETLQRDFATVMETLGYNFGAPELTRLEPRNVSKRRLGEPTWDPQLRQRVLQLEAPAIRRFYGGAHTPPASEWVGG